MHHLPRHLMELFFTADHEWIRYEGSTASIGLSSAKLTGYKKISSYFLSDIEGVIEVGTPIATFEYSDYVVDLLMPVAGRIMAWNNNLLKDSATNMLTSINQFTWIARIAPATPYERKGLIQAVNYKPLLKAHGVEN